MMRIDSVPGAFRLAGAYARAALLSLSCAAFLFTGCAKSAAEREREERHSAARARIAELERGLEDMPADASKAERLRDIIGIETMSLGELVSAIERYEDNEALLSKDVLARCYVAVAQSMRAGQEKKIENKLKWLRYGMNSFESLREEFPDDQTVYLYQASTYANFPPEVGARDEVLDILSLMRDRYASGAWSLSEAYADQLGYIYGSLAANYKDADSIDAIGEHRDSFAAAIPAFAAADAKQKAGR